MRSRCRSSASRMSGPELTERSKPGVHLLKRFWLQPVDTTLCVHRGFHETGFAQHAQMFRHGRRPCRVDFRFLQPTVQTTPETQDRAAEWLRDDFEYRLHALYILRKAYSCQGMYQPETIAQVTVCRHQSRVAAPEAPGARTFRPKTPESGDRARPFRWASNCHYSSQGGGDAGRNSENQSTVSSWDLVTRGCIAAPSRP